MCVPATLEDCPPAGVAGHRNRLVADCLHNQNSSDSSRTRPFPLPPTRQKRPWGAAAAAVQPEAPAPVSFGLTASATMATAGPQPAMPVGSPDATRPGRLRRAFRDAGVRLALAQWRKPLARCRQPLPLCGRGGTVDAADLKSAFLWKCGFDSHRPHHGVRGCQILTPSAPF